MREYLTNVFVIALAAAFLWHFSNIVLYGEHFIQEPNIVILSLETAMMVGFIIFGMLNIRKLFRDR